MFHERLTPLYRLLLTPLLITCKVVIKIGLKRLGGYGEKEVDAVGFHQPFRLLANGTEEQLIAINKPLVLRRIKREPGLPCLLRRRQGFLRLVHQAMPAPFRTGLFILHKVHPGAVEQIARRKQRNTRLIQSALLLPGQLIALFVTLGLIQGSGKQEGG